MKLLGHNAIRNIGDFNYEQVSIVGIVMQVETGASSPTGHVRHLAFTSLQFFFW